MPERKLIAVTGATGAQGGGLARAILNDPDGGFAVRALTRDPESEKAKTLADAGAEVVQTDIDDPDSVRRGPTARPRATAPRPSRWPPRPRRPPSST